MKLKYLICIIITTISNVCSAKVFDSYGVNLGSNFSNQIWYNGIKLKIDPGIDYKIGPSFFISAKRELNKHFVLRSEVGYLQKGFVKTMEYGGYLNPNNYSSNTLEIPRGDVVFHNFGINTGVEVIPLNIKFAPYILLGIQGCFLFSYDDHIYAYNISSNEYVNVYSKEFRKYNKLNLDVIVGLGFNLNKLASIEFGYNQSITNVLSFSDRNYNRLIKDFGWMMKLGINITEMINTRVNPGK